MATFQARVQGITGLTISSSGTSPTEAELTEFLKDGVIDVTNKFLAIDPNMALKFVRSSSEQTGQAGFNANDGLVLNVVREAGTNNDWRECTLGNTAYQSRYADIESLHYASKFNPRYIIGGDSSILTFPAPTSGGADSYKVYYVNLDPVNSSDAELAYSHSDLNYFPKDKVYLVVIYACIRSLDNALSAKKAPDVAGDGTELTGVSSLDNDDTVDVHADQIELDQWWSTAGHFIEGEEDNELAAAQLQKIAAYIQGYQTQLQGNSAEYSWMEARKQLLQLQYNDAFGLLAQKERGKKEYEG